MTADQRAELEARADRSVRRGELSDALTTYQALLQSFPDDASLQQKLANVQENLQPAELLNPKANFTRAAPDRPGVPSTPEQEGERLFAIGDYAGAAAAYRRALRDKPDSTLIRERLEQLFRLAQAAPRHSPTDVALPKDSREMLQALLDRIAARRR